MSSIAAVLLDMGNVIVWHDDTLLFHRLAAWGGAAPETVRRRMLALWDPINRGILAGDELRREVCRAAGAETPLPPEPFFAMWTCHYCVHRELLPVLDALLNRTKLILLSNINELHWRFVRTLIPHFERFSACVLSYELGLAKPDPQVFQVALEHAGAAPDRVAYFDDTPQFVDAACTLGIAGRRFIDTPTFRTQLVELGLPP